MSLEPCLIELRIAERGEGRGSALHRQDEALLAQDSVRHVVEACLSSEVQALLRFLPYRVEPITLKEKPMAGLAHAVASVGQITRLHRMAKGRPHEIDRGRDRLHPKRDHSHREVNFRSVGGETVLLDQVECELGETETLSVTVKDRSEDGPEKSIGVCGSPVRPILQAEVHDAAYEQTI